MKRLLVTSALPYANGQIHIGHLVEYIQTDIWVRFQNLRGNRCIYLCADDTHGTAIMISAAANNISEEEWIEQMREAHIRDFEAFQIRFDNYGSTNSPENEKLCQEIWSSIVEKGLVKSEEITQLYDEQEGKFLADRYVRGTCPKCGKPDQPGDNCQCGAHYSPTDLVDPVSTLSGTTPVMRNAEHLFVEVEQMHDFLDEWTQAPGNLQKEIANYLHGHFLNAPLRNWDVSRPAPYFGFRIPGHEGKAEDGSDAHYWYVWFDAPIGYIASTQQWCERNGEKLEDWWANEDVEIHHFIGKDITYFHTLFWPAMLKASRFQVPTSVKIHGFLTVGGEKMSKSTSSGLNTFVMASTYLNHLDPAYLRFYYASKLNARVEDLDLNFDDFISRVNSGMVGNVVNLASRTAKFAEKVGLATTYPDDGGLFEQAAKEGEEIAKAFEACEYSKAIIKILAAGDRANKYVEDNAPWILAKDPEKVEELRNVCTVGMNLFRQLAIYLAPVLPKFAEDVGKLLGEELNAWDLSQKPVLDIKIGKFKHLMKRLDIKQIEKMLKETKETTKVTEEKKTEKVTEEKVEAPQTTSEWINKDPLEATCTYDEFVRVDLRVAEILEADEVPEARKLLKLKLGLGGEESLQVFAGIKAAYKPEDLVGRLVVCVANLAPRKMKFGVSEGMVLAVGPGGEDLFVLSPDNGAQPGQRVS